MSYQSLDGKHIADENTDETTVPGTVVKVSPDETPIPTCVDAGVTAVPAAAAVERIRFGYPGARTALAVIAIAALAGSGSSADERKRFTPGPPRVSTRHGSSGQGGSNGQGGADNSGPPEEECPTSDAAIPPKFMQSGTETTVEGGDKALFTLPVAPNTVVFIYNATLGANAVEKGKLKLKDGGRICILETGKNPKENSTVEVKGEASVSIRTTGKYSITITKKSTQHLEEQPQIESVKVRALEGKTIIEQEGRDESIELQTFEDDGLTIGQEAEIPLERLNPDILAGNCAIISQGPGISESQGDSGDSSKKTVLIFAATVGIAALGRRQGKKTDSNRLGKTKSASASH